MADANPREIAPSDERPYQRATYTVEQAADTSFEINDDVGPLSSLIAFDIRNGNLTEAKSLIVKPSIGAAWYWRPVAGMIPSLAIPHVNTYIRTAIAMSEQIANLTAPQRRKVGIIIGVSRAVMTTTYNLENMDFIPGELAPALLKQVDGVNNAIRFDVTDNATAAQRVALTAELNFSEIEKAAISSIHMCALGVLPVQGFSLVTTQHHYLSDKSGASFKAFNVMEKQFWTQGNLKTWWEEDIDIVRDALFHKSGHPVLIHLKLQIAGDPKTCKMLKTAGCGSAASRLPAQEAVVRAAHSYRTLCQTVRTLFESYGGYLNFVALEHAITCVDLLPPKTTAQLDATNRPPTVPTWVVTRENSLDYLSQMLESHTDSVAFCFGFYVSMQENKQAATGIAGVDTLRNSYSLSKLATQSAASYTAGSEAFGDYAAYKRRMRNEGQIVAPNIEFIGGRALPAGAVPLGPGVKPPPPVYAPTQ